MNDLIAIRAEVSELKSKAEEAMIKPHSGSGLDKRLQNEQRGKYIAYCHIISLIDEHLNTSKQ